MTDEATEDRLSKMEQRMSVFEGIYSSLTDAGETEKVMETLRNAANHANALVQELEIRHREQKERIAYLERQLGQNVVHGPIPHATTVVQCETEGKSTGYAQTALPADILSAPIPDEQWKPIVAIDMTKYIPPPTSSLEDDLLRQVYRQNRVNPKEPVEGG